MASFHYPGEKDIFGRRTTLCGFVFTEVSKMLVTRSISDVTCFRCCKMVR
jgi:hypothetical protein